MKTLLIITKESNSNDLIILDAGGKFPEILFIEADFTHFVFRSVILK
jgi:hypothetical protein